MRHLNGRFASGNPGGPGRPRRRVEEQYLNALTEACPLDRWRTVCEKAVADAADGDSRARDWLARYLLPPADDLPEPADSDLDELSDEEVARRIRKLFELRRQVLEREQNAVPPDASWTI